MRLIILKATINYNSVRGLIMIILVPGGARLYEHCKVPTWLPWCLVVYGYMKMVIYLQLYFALLLLPYHVCLSTISIIRKGFLTPSSYWNYSTKYDKTPIPNRNHGSRLGVMSNCCNYSTTNPPNSPDRNHGSRLDVVADGDVGATPQYMYRHKTES